MQLTVDWKIKTLGEIAEVQSGGTPLKSRNEYWFGDIPWYSSGELNETFTKAPKELITPKGLEESNAKLFPKGSLLIGMYDTAALKMSILDRDAAFNQAIAGVKPNEKIELKFILYAVNSRKFEILNQRRGVRQKNLSLAKIKNIALPIPPLPEQKRIVAILDEAFEGIDRAIANTEKNLANSRKIFESYLNAIFTQKGDGWVEKSIGDVCKLSQGLAINSKTKFLLVPKSSLPLLRITDLRNNTEEQFVAEQGCPANCLVDTEDIIYTRTGNSLGLVFTGRKGVLHNNSFKIVPDTFFLDRRYLFWWLQNPSFKETIMNLASRTAQPDITHKLFNLQPITLPILSVQKEFVEKIEYFSTETQRLETIYRQKIDALNELKQSILQKAFTGELTTDTQKTVKEEIAA